MAQKLKTIYKFPCYFKQLPAGASYKLCLRFFNIAIFSSAHYKNTIIFGILIELPGLAIVAPSRLWTGEDIRV